MTWIRVPSLSLARDTLVFRWFQRSEHLLSVRGKTHILLLKQVHSSLHHSKPEQQRTKLRTMLVFWVQIKTCFQNLKKGSLLGVVRQMQNAWSLRNLRLNKKTTHLLSSNREKCFLHSIVFSSTTFLTFLTSLSFARKSS